MLDSVIGDNYSLIFDDVIALYMQSLVSAGHESCISFRTTRATFLLAWHQLNKLNNNLIS